MRILNLLLIPCVLLSCAAAQTPNPNLKFEVATIKLAEPVTTAPRAGVATARATTAPDVLALRAFTLKSLLIRAFGIKENQLTGPAWLDQSDALRFDVRAKVPSGTSLDDANIMLQNLLIERFGLVSHRETRELPGYELVIGKNGPKLKESDLTATPPPVSGSQVARLETDRNGLPQLPEGRPRLLVSVTQDGRTVIAARQQTTAQLANTLDSRIGKFVVDKTGLTAKYDFVFAFDLADMGPNFRVPTAQTQIAAASGNAAPVAADPVPSLYAAIQQELGLRLDQKKVPVNQIVIDKLEKTPTEN